MTHTTKLWLDGDDLIEKRTFDHTPYLENAKRLQNAGQTGSSDLKHAASFSPGVVEAYIA
ncbi:hypothetical protein ACFQZQ_02890 [Lysobacter koreensis]|uniref:Uncharacterized protein n=1 Tax=Lysobacter koreensis TaxID=266122 RepID=A0ABW2YK78_9GAMM